MIREVNISKEKLELLKSVAKLDLPVIVESGSVELKSHIKELFESFSERKFFTSDSSDSESQKLLEVAFGKNPEARNNYVFLLNPNEPVSWILNDNYVIIRFIKHVFTNELIMQLTVSTP